MIGEQTLIKRATVYRILTESGRLADFLHNPQSFIEHAVEILRNIRHSLAIDGISYKKLDGEEYYIQEIFESTELIANLDRNAVKTEHSVYDHIIYDSATVEKPFAEALDRDDEVKLFFKIPPRFKVETPIGEYNPDWAILLEREGVQKLYFVLETKGTTDLFDLRTGEQLKIRCGQRHFEAVGGVSLQVARSWPEFKKQL